MTVLSVAKKLINGAVLVDGMGVIDASGGVSR